MNRETYIKELAKYLGKLPKADYDDAIGYFEECFDEAGVDGEETLIAELGSPRDVATEVLANLASEKLEVKKESKKSDDSKLGRIVLITVLLIFAAPIGIPLTFALIAVIIALVITLGSFIFAGGVTAFAIFLAGLKLLLIGILTFGISASGALLLVGAGFVTVAMSLLLLILTILFAKFLMFCMKKIVEFVASKRRTK